MADQATSLLEITEARHRIISTIADAILDRIVHDSYQLLTDGEVSMHERRSLNNRNSKV